MVGAPFSNPSHPFQGVPKPPTCLSGAGPCLCPCPDAARAPGCAPGNNPRAGRRCGADPGAAGCSRGTGWGSAPGIGAFSLGERGDKTPKSDLLAAHLRGAPRSLGSRGIPGAAAGAAAVGFGLNSMQAIFEGGEEDAAPLVAGHARLLDDGDGREQRLDGVAVIPWGSRAGSQEQGSILEWQDVRGTGSTCAGAGHRLGDGAAGDGAVAVHDLLKLALAHRRDGRAQLPAVGTAETGGRSAGSSLSIPPPVPTFPAHLLWL